MVGMGRRKLRKYLFKIAIILLVVALAVDGVLSGTSDAPPIPTVDPGEALSHGSQSGDDVENPSTTSMSHAATNSVTVQDTGQQQLSPGKDVDGNPRINEYEMTHHLNRLLNEYNNSEGEPQAVHIARCPSYVECHKLGGECIDCSYNESCTYGKNITVHCTPKEDIICKGNASFTRTLICRYCYQTPASEQRCTSINNCSVVSAPRATYRANCTVKDDVLCLGRRQFHKLRQCNWTSGYRWSTALALSITLGGFGVDRFYLGLWREGLGKLFSFGGLGVWTLVDVILIATGYVGPADGSVYIF